MTEAPKFPGGELLGWPILKLAYPTQPEKLAALLPPGFEAAAQPTVRIAIYCVPVPDEPEYGVLLTVDANFQGQPGRYALGYGISQESAVFISRDMNGQPKYLCDVEYYRLGKLVRARCTHRGYTFLEYEGQSGEVITGRGDWMEREWWVKVSRAVGGAEKQYDLPPQVVRVESEYSPVHIERVQGDLRLLESPWDPLAQHLPVCGEVQAELSTAQFGKREIAPAGALDPDAYWPFADTISGSRWPGQMGGPPKRK